MRAHQNWFVLMAGHEDEEASYERTIAAENGCAIVEKLGVAGTAATRLDPRHHATA